MDLHISSRRRCFFWAIEFIFRLTVLLDTMTSSRSSATAGGGGGGGGGDDDDDTTAHETPDIGDGHSLRSLHSMASSFSSGSENSFSGLGSSGGPKSSLRRRRRRGRRRSSQSFVRRQTANQRTMGLVILVVLVVVGAGASALFLSISISSSREDQVILFDSASKGLVAELQTAFDDYKLAGQWVQETCSLASDMTRLDFTYLYENIVSTGLEFQVISWNINVTSDEMRQAIEQEAEQYYSETYPELNLTYVGIRGLEPTDDEGNMAVQPRSRQKFYFPVHYLEPLEGNIEAIDFDLYSSASRRLTINRIMETWKPLVTPRLQLVQETDPSAYSVILMHPGIPNTHPNLDRPASFSSVVLRIPDLLFSTSQLRKNNADALDIYIYDVTNHELGGEIGPEEEPVFLGAAMIRSSGSSASLGDDERTTATSSTVDFLPEITLAELRDQHGKDDKFQEENVNILSDQIWRIVVVAAPGAYDTDLTFIILAGTLLFLLVLSLGVFVYISMRRMIKTTRLKAQAQKERAALIVDNAKSAAKAERELNDFIAHEGTICLFY